MPPICCGLVGVSIPSHHRDEDDADPEEERDDPGSAGEPHRDRRACSQCPAAAVPIKPPSRGRPPSAWAMVTTAVNVPAGSTVSRTRGACWTSSCPETDRPHDWRRHCTQQRVRPLNFGVGHSTIMPDQVRTDCRLSSQVQPGGRDGHTACRPDPGDIRPADGFTPPTPRSPEGRVRSDVSSARRVCGAVMTHCGRH
jgi:hypothetical protein